MLAAILIGMPLLAKPAARPLPAPIAREIAALRKECELSGVPSDGDETLKYGDLNGDGITDYVFYKGDFRCKGEPSAFAPTAATGATAKLYLGRGDGKVALVWSGDVWGTAIKRIRGVPTLIVEAAGLECTDKPAPDIASMERCKRRVLYDPQATKWQLAP